MITYDLLIDTYIGYHPATKSAVRSALASRTDQPVSVRINSYGGDVQTALDIRQQFIDHGQITAHIYGMTASAATILAMGAKTIRMSRYALLLVHKCSGYVETWGQMNADELAEAIRRLGERKADLETIDHIVAGIYAQRTGRTLREMAELMARASWLTAEECLSLGLIDEIIEDGERAEVSAALGEDFIACGLPIPDTHNQTQTPQTPDNMENYNNAPEAENFTPEVVAIPDNEQTEDNAQAEEITAPVEDFTARIDALNDTISRISAERDTIAAERDRLAAEVEQLNARIDALNQADGDHTEDIAAADESEPRESLAAAMYENLKNIL